MGGYSRKEIEQLAKSIGKIEGVVAVVLFGSYARGDYDEGSDVDLLVLFESKEALDRNWTSIPKVTSKSELFVQAIPLALEELPSSHLLPSALKDGEALYSKRPIDLAYYAKFEPYALVAYDLRGLSAGGKVKLLQKLYGRRSGKYTYAGKIATLGGFRLGRGCFVIPSKSLREAVKLLEESGVPYDVRFFWLPAVLRPTSA